MAARDRYKRNIKCEKCNAEGVLHISEDDYPFMRNLNRSVDETDGNFSATMQDKHDIQITCKSCGHEYVYVS
jgi:predicted nucleic-acid-binding Zn-ribbon protein